MKKPSMTALPGPHRRVADREGTLRFRPGLDRLMTSLPRFRAGRTAWPIAGLLAVIAVVVAMMASSPERPEATEAAGVLADPSEVYDPVAAGEELPDGYRQLLGRDAILPVYGPTFTSPAEVDWPSDSLIIGVAGVESAKAYPVSYLNRREMVIDALDGIPILVTW